MNRVVAASLTLLASLFISIIVVAASPGMQLGQSKILDPVFAAQILGAVAGLVFVIVPIIFAKLEKLGSESKGGKAAELLTELKGELRLDTYFLMILFAASLMAGILSEIDVPFLSDCFFAKKSALISVMLLWFLLLGTRVFVGLLSSMFQVLTFDISLIENTDRPDRAK